MSPQLTAIRNHKRHPFQEDAVRKPRLLRRMGSSLTLTLVTLVLTILFGGVYVSLINASSVEGFALKELEQRVDALTRENDRLHFVASELSSLSRIERYADASSMVPIGSVEFMPTAGSAVASR